MGDSLDSGKKKSTFSIKTTTVHTPYPNTVKDLGVFATNDLLFEEHMKKTINSCRVVMGMLLRTFSTREKEPMLRMFNTYIKIKMEYCCIVWSPVSKTWIFELEKVQ